ASRITVLNDDFFDYAIACKHCAKPVCMDVCPTNAILKKGEVVTVIEKKCIGCALCIEACPFGAIHIYKNVAIICDLCDGNMECVKVCIQNALKIFKVGRIGENRRARITRRLKRASEFHAIGQIPPLEVKK
ncbi:MAG: 4Fe-4S binding protein, partial [Candidatus Thermoplasmatota archaeon]